MSTAPSDEGGGDLAGRRARTEAVLIASPYVDTPLSRAALLYDAGLDPALVQVVALEGSPLDFAASLLRAAEQYGVLSSGEGAVEAILRVTRGRVGLGGQAEIDDLLEEWRRGKHKPARPYALTEYFELLVSQWRLARSPLLPAGRQLAELAAGGKVIVSNDTLPEKALAGSVGRAEPSHVQWVTYDLHELITAAQEQRRWIILGDPGSGKTTLLSRTAAALARKALDLHSDRVPFLVDLPRLYKNYEGSLAQYADGVGKTAGIDELAAAFRIAVRRDAVVLLLDGLDEISPQKQDRVHLLLDRTLATNPRACAVISSRKVGFVGFRNYATAEIAPLQLSDQRALLIVLCGVERTREVLREIAGRRVLEEMAAVPMMLTVLALVARDAEQVDRSFFQRYSALFTLAARILLEGRHRDSNGVASPHNAEKILAMASFELHERPYVDQGIPSNDLENVVADSAGGELLQPWGDARKFVHDVAEVSNIIHAQNSLGTTYRYLHRTFREMFAASRLAVMPESTRKELVAQFGGDQKWAEVLVLAAGLVDDADAYLRQLAELSADVAVRALRETRSLSAQTAVDILMLRPAQLKSRRAVFSMLLEKLDAPELLDALWKYLKAAGADVLRIDLHFIREILRHAAPQLAAELASEAMRSLPSVPDDLLACPDGIAGDYWTHVDGGRCVIGGSADDHDRPEWVPIATWVDVSPFDIGRVTVTNAIYEVFDPNHRLRRAFSDKVPAPELDDHPVVDVTWHEAALFCDWLAGAVPGVRLPTEVEWEKAASWDGRTKRRFPWGDDWDLERLNCWQSGPNRTTRVGSYPAGASPCGALDMAGNVWEWCLNWFEEELPPAPWMIGASDPRGPVQGRRRVDRGGGWYYDVGQPCTWIRAADDPSDAFRHCGFRIVRSPVAMPYGCDLFDCDEAHA